MATPTASVRQMSSIRKNPLELEYIWLSESYLDEIQGVEGLTVESEPEYIQFDQQGNILRMP